MVIDTPCWTFLEARTFFILLYSSSEICKCTFPNLCRKIYVQFFIHKVDHALLVYLFTHNVNKLLSITKQMRTSEDIEQTVNHNRGHADGNRTLRR